MRRRRPRFCERASLNKDESTRIDIVMQIIFIETATVKITLRRRISSRACRATHGGTGKLRMCLPRYARRDLRTTALRSAHNMRSTASKCFALDRAANSRHRRGVCAMTGPDDSWCAVPAELSRPDGLRYDVAGPSQCRLARSRWNWINSASWRRAKPWMVRP
jgi:hypothetical protein